MPSRVYDSKLTLKIATSTVMLTGGIYEVETSHQDGTWTSLPNLALNGPAAGVVNVAFELPAQIIAGDVLNVRIRITDPSQSRAVRTYGQASDKPSMET